MKLESNGMQYITSKENDNCLNYKIYYYPSNYIDFGASVIPTVMSLQEFWDRHPHHKKLKMNAKLYDLENEAYIKSDFEYECVSLKNNNFVRFNKALELEMSNENTYVRYNQQLSKVQANYKDELYLELEKISDTEISTNIITMLNGIKVNITSNGIITLTNIMNQDIKVFKNMKFNFVIEYNRILQFIQMGQYVNYTIVALIKNIM